MIQFTPEQKDTIFEPARMYSELELKFAQHKLGAATVAEALELRGIRRESIEGLSTKEYALYFKQLGYEMDRIAGDSEYEKEPEKTLNDPEDSFIDICGEFLNKALGYFGDLGGWKLWFVNESALSLELKNRGISAYTSLGVIQNKDGTIAAHKTHRWIDMEAAMGFKASKQRLAVKQTDVDVLISAAKRLKEVNERLEQDI